MLLKSLELQGFKTFPDKTLLKFEEGITAVVGPNGSGKSNISDAMRWVLGEQSTRALRCSKMEDIIFSGTPQRRAQGFAEVTITIDNADRRLNFDGDTVAITRRYYRSGESEYLINSSPCRLMDIQDILADPSLPRRFDHELASFDSVEELIASRWSPTGAGWLDMSGHDGLASAMGALGIKQTDNVREWYALAFPGDELAVAINPSLTFDNAIAAVPTGDGFYTALGDAADSLLRERIFEELCNRYGYTYDEVYDSWLNESPLPSPAISQQPEKIAVAAGYRFNLVDAKEASGIDLKGCGTVVTVDGHDYEIMKGATYEDSRKVDDLLDSHGDKPISAFRKQPQGMSLKQAVREAREASAKLAEENGGTDDPDGKDER